MYSNQKAKSKPFLIFKTSFYNFSQVLLAEIFYSFVLVKMQSSMERFIFHTTDIIDFLLHNFTKLRCSYSLFLQPFLVILAILAALPSITSSLNLCLTWDKNCMQHCRWNLTYSFNNGTNASLTTESIKHF